MSKRGGAGAGKSGAPALFVGIDLGTSRSAVCASNGIRRCIESVVGWPKDLIARRLVGKPIVFGEENQRLRLSLEMVRPMERGVLQKGPDRGEEAARELAKHLVGLAEPAEGELVQVVVGAPANATAYSKQAIRDAIADLSENVMVVSEPFTVAYALGQLDNAIIVDIGAGTMDLCLMHGMIPRDEDQRSIPQAGDVIDQQLQQLLSERYPEASFSRNMVRQFKEAHGYVGGPERRVKVTMPAAGKPTEYDITEEMQRACSSILPYLRESLRGMISSADPEFQHRLRQNIVLAGGTSQIRGLKQYVETALADMGGARVTVVEDPVFTGAAGALAIAMDTPPEDWARLRSEPDLVL